MKIIKGWGFQEDIFDCTFISWNFSNSKKYINFRAFAIIWGNKI